MSMDTYVHEMLIRQQIAESDRLAAMRHLVRAAQRARAPRTRWAALRRLPARRGVLVAAVRLVQRGLEGAR